MAPKERTMVSLAKTARVISIRLGDNATRAEILECVGQALDVDAGILASDPEHGYECWAPGLRVGTPDAPVTEKEAA